MCLIKFIPESLPASPSAISPFVANPSPPANPLTASLFVASPSPSASPSAASPFVASLLVVNPSIVGPSIMVIRYSSYCFETPTDIHPDLTGDLAIRLELKKSFVDFRKN